MSERVLVVGDVIFDEIVELVQGSMSAEELPTYFELTRRTLAGGAANVAKHLAQLGASVCLIHGAPGPISFFGDGITGAAALRIGQLHTGRGRIATKTRFYDGTRKVFKLNRFEGLGEPIPASLIDSILNKGAWETVVACDNGLGSLRDQEAELVQICRRHGRELVVDAQLSQTTPNLEAWRGATEVMLNEKEAHDLSWSHLFERSHVKRGPAGSSYFDGDELHWQDGFSVDAVDTVGAGDAYLAAWVRSGDLRLANLWAALSCTKIGTGLPSIEEIEDESLARLCKR